MYIISQMIYHLRIEQYNNDVQAKLVSGCSYGRAALQWKHLSVELSSAGDFEQCRATFVICVLKFVT